MIKHLRTWLGHLFSKEGFRGPVLTLMSGSVLAMGFSYLVLPFLTRLYTPASFGVYDYFVTLLSILTPLSSLRYEDAIMIPREDDEAANVLGLSVLLMLAFIVLLGVLSFWGDSIAPLLGLEEIMPWLWLLPLTLLWMRLSKLAEVWLTRKKQFRMITAGDVTNKFTMTTTKLGAGFIVPNASAGGLIGGFFVAHVASSAVNGWFLFQQSGRAIRKALRFSRIRALLHRYRRFPFFSAPAALLNTLLGRLPFLLLPVFFDFTMLGHYGRAFAIIVVPLSLLGGAIAQVFFVHAAEATHDDSLPQLTRDVHARLVMIGLPPALLLVVAGPDLFDVVLGDAWTAAGRYAQYIAPWLFLASVASPLTRLFDVLERQRADLLVSIGMFVTLTAALLIGGATGDVIVTLLLVSVVGALMRITQIGVLMHLAEVKLRATLAPYGRYALFTLPALVLTAAAMTADLPWLTTLAAALGGMVYAGLVLWKDRLLTLDAD